MRTNPILAALKLIVLVVFTIYLIKSFIQTEWLEEKTVKTREKVDGLGSNVASLGRKVDEATKAAEESRRASERTHERLNDILEAVKSGAISGGSNGNTESTAPRKGGTKTTCNGVTVYARNAGWTVLADDAANADPKADIPHDQVDWDATLNHYLMGEPADLNYYGANGDVEVENTWALSMDVLATRKHTDLKQFKAVLAERIEESPDRKEYMIYLRKRVPWHTPALDLALQPWLKKQRFVTAEDVKFTFDILRDPAAGSPQKVYYEDITEVNIVNDHQIHVKWNDARFYSRSMILDLQTMPKHIWANDPDGKPYGKANVGAAFNKHWFGKSICGCGPYRFVEYKPSLYLKFERNEDYWGDRAPCKEFYYHIISDENARMAKFFNKGLIVNGLRMPAIIQYIIEGDPDVPMREFTEHNKPAPGSWEWTHFKYLSPVYSGFAWNMRRPHLEDRRVRTALTLALDREAIVEKLRRGLGKVIAVGQSTRSVYYPQDIEPLPYDLGRARKLLAEAGWADSNKDGILDKKIAGERMDLEINLVLSANSTFQKQLAQMYKGELIKIGIRLDIELVDSALWSQKKSDRDFDGFIIFWYAGMDSDPEQLWASDKANEANSDNYAGYENPEADAIFKALVTTFDYPTRIKLHHDWYQMQFRDQPYTWMNMFKSVVAVNADWRIPEPRLVPRPYIDTRIIFKWKRRP